MLFKKRHSNTKGQIKYEGIVSENKLIMQKKTLFSILVMN